MALIMQKTLPEYPGRAHFIKVILLELMYD
jgi:hypothetical protein